MASFADLKSGRRLCLGLFFFLSLYPLYGDVNPNGSYTYSIPIVVPAGTAGLQPNLSITYNSGSGNGPLGVGFSLQGIRAITRGNYGRGVNYDGQDTYFTDSGRLIDVSGNKTGYHTAEESWEKYEPVGQCGDGPCSWVMTDRNGVKYEFGNSTDTAVLRRWSENVTTTTYRLEARETECKYTASGWDCSDSPNQSNCNETYKCGDILCSEAKKYRVKVCNYQEYAAHTNSVIEKHEGPGIKTWLLKKVTDAHGNFYVYDYRIHEGQFYPVKVTYGQGAGLNYFKSISFAYDETSRPDKDIAFFAQSETAIHWRLQSISVDFEVSCYWIFTCNQHVRHFDLSYEVSPSTGLSRIKQIQEFGPGNAPLPPQIFSWQDGGNGNISVANYTRYDDQDYSRLIAGDFNGDGKTDFLKFKADCKTWVSLVSAGDGSVKSWAATFTVEDGYSGLLSADVNGDGKSDVIKYTPDFKIWITYLNNGDGSFRSIGPMFTREDGYAELVPADINGDGKIDLIKYSIDTKWILSYLSNGDGTFTQINSDLHNEDGYSRLQFVDVNGDGKVDAIKSTPDTKWIITQLGTGDGKFIDTFATHEDSIMPNLFVADWNGDGLPDLIKSGANLMGFKTLINVGKGEFLPTVWTDQYTSEVGYSGIAISDLNGDGKQDIIKYTPDVRYLITYISRGDGNFTKSLLKENAEGYSGLISADLRGNGRPDLIKYTSDIIHLIDIRGNAQASDLVTGLSQNGKTTTIEYNPAADLSSAVQPTTASIGNANGFPRNLVTRVMLTSDKNLDGVGANDTFSTSYTYTNGRYFPGYLTERADLGFAEIRTTDENSGNYSIVRYRQNKPFHGMVSSSASYLANGTKLAETIHGSPQQFYCNEAGCNQNANSDPTPAEPRQIRPGIITQKSWIYPSTGAGSVGLVTTTIENATYDLFGNPTHIVETKDAGGGVFTSHTYANFINDTNAASTRAIGLIYEHKKCVEDCSVSNTSEDRHIFYDGQTAGLAGALHAVSSTESRLGAITLKKSYTYTANGNLESVSDDTGARADFTYDPYYKTFVTKTVLTPGSGANPANTYTIEKETHPAFGIETYARDSNGAVAEKDIDAFGRVTATRLKDDAGILLNRSSVEYKLWGNNEPSDHYVKSCAHFKTSPADTGLTGENCAYEYSDALGRAYLKIALAVEGSDVKYQAIHTRFDARGRKAGVSKPYFKADATSTLGIPEAFSEITYDAIGRIWREKGFDGKTIQRDIGYEGAGLVSQAVTDARGIQKEMVTDARGLVTRVTSAKGMPEEAKVAYTYYVNGLLESVTSPQGVTTMTYEPDTKQQRSIIDPHAGTTLYTYEKSPASPAFGKLRTETRPDGNAVSGTLVTTNDYNDVWGRLTQTTKGDGAIVRYTYDESVYKYNKGKLTTLSHEARGYTVTDHFTRDARGNTVSTQRQIGHTTLQLCANTNDLPCTSETHVDEDGLGRPEKFKLPDGTFTELQYYGATSQLANLNHNGTTYAAYDGYNKTGSPEKIIYGNGIEGKYVYLPSGAVDNFQLKKAASALADFKFGYDENYNITGLADRVMAQNANDLVFTYDNLDRLRTTTRGQEDTLAFDFDTDGANGASQGKLKTRGQRRMQYAANAIRPSSDEVWDTQSGAWQQTKTMSWSGSGNLITRGSAAYQYDGDNKMKHSSDPDRGEADYFYDASGQRFLKIFKRSGLPAVKTWYLAGSIELREKWSDDLTQKYGAQSTKYIFGADGKRLASITGSTTLASAQQAARYYALADMYSAGSAEGAFLQAKFTFYAFMHDDVAKKKAYLCMLIILALGIVVFLSLSPREGSTYALSLVGKRLVAMLMVASFGSANCGSNVVNNVGTFGGVTVDFNDIYSGLPVGTVYYHSDHLGSTTILTDAGGEEIFRLAYDSYGSLDISNSGKLNYTTMELERTSDQAGFAALAVRFTGQEYDPETGFYYYNARYYSSELGIFTSADTMVPDPTSAHSYNRHMYARGNPIMYTDPTGHWEFYVGVDSNGGGSFYFNPGNGGGSGGGRVDGVLPSNSGGSSPGTVFGSSDGSHHGNTGYSGGANRGGYNNAGYYDESGFGGNPGTFPLMGYFFPNGLGNANDLSSFVAINHNTSALQDVAYYEGSSARSSQYRWSPALKSGADSSFKWDSKAGTLYPSQIGNQQFSSYTAYCNNNPTDSAFDCSEAGLGDAGGIDPFSLIGAGAGLFRASLRTGLKKEASDGLINLFRNGLESPSIINVRSQLLRDGFQQTLTTKKSGYLFRHISGEEVRIMRRNGSWDLRIKNRFGNDLDRLGNVGIPETTHDIYIFSK
jgi:RHS repeat-associated protein